jgi:hypothetical protein
MDERKDTADDSIGVPEAEKSPPGVKLYYWHAEIQEYTDRDGDECTAVAVVAQADYVKLRTALEHIRDDQIIQGMSPAMFAGKVLTEADASAEQS